MTTKKQDLLDRIDVREPCTESWEEMTGNDKVRFCSHCAKNVYDISAYTRERAEKLVRDSAGGLCVRYRKDDSGRVVTAPPRFTQIKRQAKIAAGVLATTLSVASMAYTQGGVGLPLDKGKVEKREKDKNAAASGSELVGLVTDPFGALIPGADVILTRADTCREYHVKTNSVGEFLFQNVPEGEYKLEISATGFEKTIIRGFTVSGSSRKELVLEPLESIVVGELIVVGEPIACDENPVLGTVVTVEKMESLPIHPSKSLPTMGLFPGIVEKPEDKKPPKKSKKKLPK